MMSSVISFEYYTHFSDMNTALEFINSPSSAAGPER